MRRNSFYAYAQNDLLQLDINKQHGYRPYTNTCVMAQQYVEKMLKDKIQDFGSFPSRTHNLHILMEELDDMGIPIDADLYDMASVLTSFYISARYPDAHPNNIGEEIAEESCEYAFAIVDYYESYIPDYVNRTYYRLETSNNISIKKSFLHRLLDRD